jgi:hypothetical protein
LLARWPALRALLRCFLPGGPPGLPFGVLESPGFFCFAIRVRIEACPYVGLPGHLGFGHFTSSTYSPAIRPSPRSVRLYITTARFAPQNGQRSRAAADRMRRA